jgi:hypothetical protein
MLYDLFYKDVKHIDGFVQVGATLTNGLVSA